ARGDFSSQIVFRREVSVEAAVRQAGALHDVGDTDAVVAPLAKERARDLENLFAVGRRLIARHSHRSTPFGIHLTLYMMGIINIFMTTIIKRTGWTTAGVDEEMVLLVLDAASRGKAATTAASSPPPAASFIRVVGTDVDT